MPLHGHRDVIFPGMLVISSITFLPGSALSCSTSGGPVQAIHLGPMMVGMGTLFGAC